MTLQFKMRHCNGILFHGVDVSLQFHSWQVCTYFCVCVIYCDKKGNSIKTETYGLKSQKTPLSIIELAAFENDLIELMKNIKF